MIDKLNERSCVLDSFAYVLNTPSEGLAYCVGHNGPDGFHSQELIEVALAMGYAVTTIERKPVGQSPEDGSMRLIQFNGETADERFGRQLCGRQGVLMGRLPYTNKPHAVAWDDPWIYDPGCGQQYSLLDENNLVNDINFTPMVFLRIDEL